MTAPVHAPVLVVDDYEPWRRQISSILRKSGWQVVGEASDGLEAIQKTQLLHPELVLLDVGLPELNGIEVAKRILTLEPRSRILFVSAHRCWDIAEAALCAGARGYIVKDDAGDELLPAMEAILKGKRFVSSTFTGRALETTNGDPNAHDGHFHEARFFSEDSELLDEFARYVAAGLRAGKTVIVLPAEARRNQLREKLRACGVDIERALQEGRYISYDAADAFSSFMVDGRPDEERFWKDGISLLMRAARASKGEHPRVAAVGEGTAGLWGGGNPEAAVRVEHLWDELAKVFGVDVLCLFSMQGLRDEEDNHTFRRICQEHSLVHAR